MIRSQIEEHFRKKRVVASTGEDEVDIVRGKGNGLIILLHGQLLANPEQGQIHD